MPAFRLFHALIFCAALACPTARAAGPAAEAPLKYRLRIAGSRVIGTTLLKNLLEDFLKGEGWTDIHQVATEENAYTLAGRPAPDAAQMGISVSLCDPEEALQLLDEDLIDIAMVSRRALPAEAARLTKLPDLLSPRCEHLIGLDALAVIVHPSNPLTVLTREQLKDIFLRRTTLWSDASEPLGAIHPYAAEEKVGAAQIFRAAIHPADPLPERVERRPDSAAVGRAVADDPRGIGFAALPAVGKNRVVAIKVGAAVLLPEPALVRRGEYPLSRPLYLYSAPRGYSLTEAFLRYATGEKGQAVVKKQGFIAGPDAIQPASPAPGTPADSAAPAGITAPPNASGSPAAEAPAGGRLVRPTATPKPAAKAEKPNAANGNS